MRQADHEADVADLYADGFDPVLIGGCEWAIA
jgi:hypothetical protein